MTDCQRIKTSKTVVINKGQSQREKRAVVGCNGRCAVTKMAVGSH